MTRRLARAGSAGRQVARLLARPSRRARVGLAQPCSLVPHVPPRRRPRWFLRPGPTDHAGCAALRTPRGSRAEATCASRALTTGQRPLTVKRPRRHGQSTRPTKHSGRPRGTAPAVVAPPAHAPPGPCAGPVPGCRSAPLIRGGSKRARAAASPVASVVPCVHELPCSVAPVQCRSLVPPHAGAHPASPFWGYINSLFPAEAGRPHPYPPPLLLASPLLPPPSRPCAPLPSSLLSLPSPSRPVRMLSVLCTPCHPPPATLGATQPTD